MVTINGKPAKLPDPELGDMRSGGSSTRGSHRLALALRCEVAYGLGVHMKLRASYENRYALTGTLVHLHAAYYHASRMLRPPPWFSETSLADAINKRGAGRQELIEVAEQAWAEWPRRFQEDKMRPLYVETEFGCSLGDILPDCDPAFETEFLTARLDHVDVDPEGGIWLADIKSKDAHSPRLPAWNYERNEYRLSFQISHNLHVARAYFSPRPVRGFMIERIKRSPPYDVTRDPVAVPPIAYSRVPELIQHAVKEERRIVDKIAARQVLIPTGMATGECKWCEFADVCRAGSDVEQKQIMRSEQYRLRVLED